MLSVLDLFDKIVYLYIWVLIINAVISWLVAFNVLNTSNRFVYSTRQEQGKKENAVINK